MALSQRANMITKPYKETTHHVFGVAFLLHPHSKKKTKQHFHSRSPIKLAMVNELNELVQESPHNWPPCGNVSTCDSFLHGLKYIGECHCQYPASIPRSPIKLAMVNELNELVQESPHNWPHVNVSTCDSFLHGLKYIGECHCQYPASMPITPDKMQGRPLQTWVQKLLPTCGQDDTM